MSISSTKDFLAEEDISDSYGKPSDYGLLRRLDQFSVYSHGEDDAPETTGNVLRDLESIKSKTLFASGTILEEGLESVPAQLTSLYMWSLDADGDAPALWIQTKHAWYRLENPSEKYSPFFAPLRAKIELLASISVVLRKNKSISYSDMLEALSTSDPKDSIDMFITENAKFLARHLNQLYPDLTKGPFAKELRNKAAQAPDDDEEVEEPKKRKRGRKKAKDEDEEEDEEEEEAISDEDDDEDDKPRKKRRTSNGSGRVTRSSTRK